MRMRLSLATPLLLASIALGQNDALQRGLQLFQQQNYEGALQQFREARRGRPSDASLVNFIGITETKLGRIEEANHDYEAAARLDPKLPGPPKNLGFNYLGKGQYVLAEKPLHTALLLNGADPYVHYYLAILYLSTDRGQAAIPHLKPAEPLLVNDPATAYAAIVACLKADASEQALTIVAALEPQGSLSAQQEFQLAELLNARQLYADAAERFRRIVDLQPGSWQNEYNLALALMRAGKSKEALPLLSSLTTQRAGDASLLSGIASTYETAGEQGLALATYRKAIAVEPGNPDRYLDCSRLLMDLDRYEEAMELVKSGVPLVPEAYPLTIRMGAIEMMRGHHDAARGYYRQAVAERPALALGYVALAQSYMKEGNDHEALRLLTEARGAVGQDFALEYVFGLVSFQVGQQAQAMLAFKTAESLSPSVVEPHYQLGLLYMQLQQWSEAQNEFEQVLKLDPQHAGTYYQLSRTYQRLGDAGKAQAMAKQASLLTKTQREAGSRSQELQFGVPAHE